MRSSSIWAVLCAASAYAAGPTGMVRNMMIARGNGGVNGQSRHQNQRLSARDTRTEPLECFQVQTPVLLPQGAVVGNHVVAKSSSKETTPSCEVVLMQHHFGNSYGHPFVGQYTPPKCPFTRVVMNFTVVSEGRQFDRLAVMYLGDTEVWRTSTAEPKAHPGIVWTYVKDMTPYLSLWKQPQTLIFDLGNLINEKYTGLFNTTLTATFINDNDIKGPGAKPADQIVPLSAKKGAQGAPSAFTYPQDTPSIPVALPQNINRAVVSISANGQADEEFWWSNVPDSSVNLFNDTTGPLPGHSSFREVQLYIDGQLAGLAWPFPVVFTGGISPPQHRPIVGLDAFDLREQEVDITPWLGLLCDGEEHTFSFKIVGEYNLIVLNHWVLSGKIFLWLDNPESVTQGSSSPTIRVTSPVFSANPPVYMGNGAYKYTQHTIRTLSITSQIIRNGKSTQSTWSQTFSMHNDGHLANDGNFQQVNAIYAGHHTAGLNNHSYFQTRYSYPIDMILNATGPTPEYSLRLDAQLSQGLDITTSGSTIFSTGLEPFMHNLPASTPGTSLGTFRKGSAEFTQFNNGASSTGHGDTRQLLRFSAAEGPLLYLRDITAESEVITNDETFVYMADYPLLPSPQSKVLVEPKGSSNNSKSNSSDALEFVPLPDKARGGVKACFGKNVAEQAKER